MGYTVMVGWGGTREMFFVGLVAEPAMARPEPDVCSALPALVVKY